MAFTASSIDIDEWIELFEDYVEIKDVLRNKTEEHIPVKKLHSERDTEYKDHHNGRVKSRNVTLINREETRSIDVNTKTAKFLFQRDSEISGRQRLENPGDNSGPARNPNSAPTTKPKVKIINRGRLKHEVEYSYDSAVQVNQKPNDIRGCEIWYRRGDLNSDKESGFEYLSTDTNSPYIMHFRGLDSGKTVHYKLRWVNSRNEPGPWSDIVSSKIRSGIFPKIRLDILILIFQKLIF